MDKKTETFLEYRNLLFSIAYHMLGQIDAAEDIVQDSYLKWIDADTDDILHIKAFLVRIVTNQSINYLQSARIRREEYVGIWLPEPLPQAGPDRNFSRIESWHALSIGMMLLLEKLTPQERAVFLLKEIFAYDYAELAAIIGKSADNCRQILRRAKTHLGDDKNRFEVDLRVHEKLLYQFHAAVAEGDMEALIGLLKEDINLYADGDGRTSQVQGQRLSAFRKPIFGVDKVGRALLTVVPKFRQSVPDFRQEITITNGLPSIVSYSGNEPLSLVALEPEGDRIRNIFVQNNPDKLKHLKKAL